MPGPVVCDVQVLARRASRAAGDLRAAREWLVCLQAAGRPFPFLDREEFRKNMIVAPWGGEAGGGRELGEGLRARQGERFSGQRGNMKVDDYTRQLDQLLGEDLSLVKQRERAAFDNLLAEADNRVVLFGAGNLGRKALRCLRSAGRDARLRGQRRGTLGHENRRSVRYVAV